MAVGYRYQIVRIDGRNRRWIAWADRIADARKLAADLVRPGFPVAIERNRDGTELERITV